MSDPTDRRQPTGRAIIPDDTVTSDMLAIFGPGTRIVTDEPIADLSAEHSPANSRVPLVAVVSVLLTAAIGAGTMLGADVIGVQAPVAAADGPARQMKRAAVQSAPAPAEAALVVPQPEQQVASLVSRPAVPVIAESPRTFRAPDVVPAAPPVVTAPPPVAVARAEPPTAAPAIVVEPDPEPSPVQVAERRAAEAYDVAASAGVRPRLLRGYRLELDRARGEAVERPRYAERLFGMIESDLSQLADETDDRDGGRGR